MDEKKINLASSLLAGLAIILYLLALFLFFSQRASASKPADSDQVKTSLLQQIQARGYIKCGVATNRPGYSSMLSREPTPNDLLIAADQNQELYDNATGIEADMCRAVAIGLFGELAGRVYFKNLDGNWNTRMEAVETGAIDLLFRGTSMAPDLGLSHRVSRLPVIYLEPIMMLVRKTVADSPESAPDDAKVCTIENTFSYFSALQFAQNVGKRWVFPSAFQPAVKYTGYAKMLEDYKSDQCQILVGRYSSIRNVYVNHKFAEEHHRLVLGDAYHVPIAGVVKSDEYEWQNLVSQSVWAPMKAQYQQFTSEAVVEGFNAKVWSLMNLDPTFATKIIKHLGNYAQIYQRNLGDDLPNAGPNNHFLANPAGRLLVPL